MKRFLLLSFVAATFVAADHIPSAEGGLYHAYVRSYRRQLHHAAPGVLGLRLQGLINQSLDEDGLIDDLVDRLLEDEGNNDTTLRSKRDVAPDEELKEANARMDKLLETLGVENPVPPGQEGYFDSQAPSPDSFQGPTGLPDVIPET